MDRAPRAAGGCSHAARPEARRPARRLLSVRGQLDEARGEPGVVADILETLRVVLQHADRPISHVPCRVVGRQGCGWLRSFADRDRSRHVSQIRAPTGSAVGLGQPAMVKVSPRHGRRHRGYARVDRRPDL